MLKRLIRNDRPWKTGFERVPRVTLEDERVRVEDFRNFRYHCDGTHEPSFETREYKLSEVCSVDFIVVPFETSSPLAHTMVSFGFVGGAQLVVSIEARLRVNQKYSVWKGLLCLYPIMYVIADERDAIGHRTEFRGNDVYLYHVDATPAELQQFLRGMLVRARQLAERTERYNTLINNCATNIRNHINQIWPGRVPWGWGVLLPGRADFLAYRLGFLKSNETFDQTRLRARINDLAAGNWHDERFSQLIRPNRG